MFRLDIHSDLVHADYVAKVLDGLKNRIINGRRITHASRTEDIVLSDEIKQVLLPNFDTSSPDDSVLRHLLINKPVELKALNDGLWNIITADIHREKVSIEIREEEIKGKRGKSKERDKLKKEKKALIEKEKTLRHDLLILFNYDGVFNDNKENGYWLAKLIGRNTCTYCNRQYIFTVESVGKSDDKRFISRPTFDHWFPKSDYPLMSLSLYNLIPSCTVCNSSVKGTAKMSLSTHVHPYVHELDGLDFTFRVYPKPLRQLSWGLTINRVKGSKIDRTISDMALTEVYAHHADLEVKDIMDFNSAYTEGYINSLIEKVYKDNHGRFSKKDVYRILFGTEYEEARFLDRPFSKLKRDILKQIGISIDDL